jgi:hypothetical protein
MFEIAVKLFRKSEIGRIFGITSSCYQDNDSRMISKVIFSKNGMLTGSYYFLGTAGSPSEEACGCGVAASSAEWQRAYGWTNRKKNQRAPA